MNIVAKIIYLFFKGYIMYNCFEKDQQAGSVSIHSRNR
jgi:hypothetical protein